MPLRWLILSLEPWLYDKLIRSPTWHSLVRGIHRRVHRLRTGEDPLAPGGTNLKHPAAKNQLMKFYMEELRNQLRSGVRNGTQVAGKGGVKGGANERKSVAEELRMKWEREEKELQEIRKMDDKK